MKSYMKIYLYYEMKDSVSLKSFSLYLSSSESDAPI